MYAWSNWLRSGTCVRLRPIVMSRLPRAVIANEAGPLFAMRGGLSFPDGLGRRLLPFGAKGMAEDRPLKVEFEVRDWLSRPEAVGSRCDESGMRDLEFGDPSPGFVCCKDTETAISGVHGSARGSLERLLVKSLRALR